MLQFVTNLYYLIEYWVDNIAVMNNFRHEEGLESEKLIWFLAQKQITCYMHEKAGKLLEQDHETMSYSLFYKQKSEMQFIFTVIRKSNAILFQCEFQVQAFQKSEKTRGIYELVNQSNCEVRAHDSKIILLDQGKRLKRVTNILLRIFNELGETQIGQMIKNKIRDEVNYIEKILRELTKQSNDKVQKKIHKKDPKKLMQTIKMAKKAIQYDIGTRAKSTIFKNDQNLDILNFRQLNPCIMTESGKKEEDQVRMLEELILQQKIEEKNKKNEKKIEQIQNIVRIIDFVTKKIDETWVSPESGFGNITKIYATYKLKNSSVSSINVQTNELLQQYSQNKSITTTLYSSLIEKIADSTKANKKSADESFQTEYTILKFLRDKYCNFIASYYLKEIKENQERADSFYLNFYSKEMSDLRDDYREQLRAIRMLAEAIKFLHENKIIHRDLKPLNIMVSDNKFLKLIDFGSAWIMNQRNPNISQTLRTTIKYNMTYNRLQTQFSLEQDQFQTHQYFDVYAFGKIVEGIFLKIGSKSTCQKQGTINMHLNWLQSMCKEQNPYNRISPEGIVYFLQLVFKFFIIFNPPRPS